MSITGSEQWMYSAGAEFYNFPIEQSLRFEDGDSAYLSKTPASSGNLDAWTFSCWVKRGNLGVGTQTLFGASSDVNNWMYIGFTSGNTLTWTQADGGSVTATVTTSQVFRDVSSFYHIQCTYESSEASAADRMRIYINGERVTAFGSASYLAQNADSRINRNIGHTVGRLPYTAAGYFDGYMAEVNFVDGSSLEPTSFGEVKSGIWIPKDPTGLTYGTNGFRLAFADSAAIGDDTSGNTNDWTANNLVASDVVLDSPTNNFAVLNNLDNISTTYSEGNLKISQSSFNYNSRGTFGLTSGKYYWEVRMDSTHGEFGVCENGKMPQTDPQGAYPAYFIYNNGSTGVIYNNATSVSSSSATMTNWAAGDVAMIAYDADNGNLYHGLNGVWQNSADPAAGTGAIITGITSQFGGSLVPFFGSGTASARNWVVNFGQDSTFANLRAAGGNADENGLGDFAHPVPSGFLSLCSANLPKGAIDTLADETPEDYFNTVLWTGDNTTGGRSVTGVGFSPDLVYAKCRSAAYSPLLYDSIRGTGATAELKTDGAEAEGGSSSSERGYLNSFDSDGFSSVVGTNGDNLYFNQLNQTYVAWNWKAGGAGVSNTDGSITSTVSVGATSQQNWFSVVSYTGNATAGATVGHGLGVAPSMIIVKNRTDGSSSWCVSHTGYPTTQTLYLDSTTSVLTRDRVTARNTSTFTVGSHFEVNGSGNDIIAYCFANAENLCKAGTYTGNGSTDGAFVYTGFRPAFVMVKSYTAGEHWNIPVFTSDTNGAMNTLSPNLSNAERTMNQNPAVDYMSNGFKIRTSDANYNSNGGGYIYLAIAEQPFKYANAR